MILDHLYPEDNLKYGDLNDKNTVRSYLPKARFQPPFFFLSPTASVESLASTSLSSSSAPDSAPCSSHESLGVAPAIHNSAVGIFFRVFGGDRGVGFHIASLPQCLSPILKAQNNFECSEFEARGFTLALVHGCVRDAGRRRIS